MRRRVFKNEFSMVLVLSKERCKVLGTFKRCKASSSSSASRRLRQASALIRIEKFAQILYYFTRRFEALHESQTPEKTTKRKSLKKSEVGIVRRKAEGKDHVWSVDFIFDRTTNGRSFKYSSSWTNLRGSAVPWRLAENLPLT